MARREKKPVHHVQMTDGKRAIIQQLLQEYDIETAKKAGPFTFEFYFLKSMKSDLSIIKNVVKKDRKTLLDKG